MIRLRLVFCSLMLVTSLVGCGDDDGGASGTSGSSGSGGGGSSGDSGATAPEGSECNAPNDCDTGLTCVPSGVTNADPLFCARGCERQDQCDATAGERCVAFCDAGEPGCTEEPGHCAKVITTAWEPCGFSITSTCGTTLPAPGDDLTCIIGSDRGRGFCAQLCEFATSGQCPETQICSSEILASNTIGVCATPKQRGQACDPIEGDVCAADDICASLTDPSGAGTCRQFCGQGLPACAGATECTVFAQFVVPGGVQSISACFPTADGQDGGI